MEKKYELFGSLIQISFQENSVHIVNDKELWQLLSADIENRTAALAHNIRNDFEETYKRALEISEDALVVEIWGHVYFEYFALAIQNLFKLKLIERMVESAVTYSELIDCGEKGYDNNRWLWDMLAPHKTMIAGWLPKDIDAKNWKS